MDEIIIENLKVYAYHGVYKEENEKGQNFYVNAVLYTDTRKAGQEDNFEYTTSYGQVCQFIHEYISRTLFKLIETVAEMTAEAVLAEFPLIEGITIEIRKPEAPIGLEYESVSVRITRRWHMACIATGSNIGDRQKYIEDGIAAFENDSKCRIIKKSDYVRTTPYGDVEQDEFLNGAVLIKTLYTPEELLDKIHETEDDAGRQRTLRWGPRTLDLDIIFYDDVVMNTDTLQIPHIDMQNRDFVLKPMVSLVPYVVHPVFNKTVLQLYEEVCKSGEKHVIEQETEFID